MLTGSLDEGSAGTIGDQTRRLPSRYQEIIRPTCIMQRQRKISDERHSDDDLIPIPIPHSNDKA